MAAQSVDTFVLAFSDPALRAIEPERARVNVSISFDLFDDDNVRTLSTNTVSNGADVEGLLYVPDLDPLDPCLNISQSYIPHNVTRKANLPIDQYSYIAFAPWISVPCAKSYLAASSGARALMTYLPDNGRDTPPLANNESWDLHDGGQWKSQNKFPVYAIPGADGAAIMQQMGQYSGNSSSPRIRDMLAQEQLEPTDYVRLYTSFGTSESSNLPTLWAFLLIVLGLILFIVGLTSVLMHLIQRRRRRDLQRRVTNGEVDLESLGIKRTRISQRAVDSLPTSTYTHGEGTPSGTDAIVDQVTEQSPPQPVLPTLPLTHLQWSQPTCPICLDDFVSNTTTIRSLPCHHIYHPECIDPFLRESSSLCPVCKASVLPTTSKFNISEPVTNAMVRHERRIRRMRQERQSDHLAVRPEPREEGRNRGWIASLKHRVRGRRPPRPMVDAAPPSSGEMEMGVVDYGASSEQISEDPATNSMAGATTPPHDADLRREWMRGRLSSLRGQHRTLDEEEAERSARLPRWRKAFGAAFPGFR